MDDAARHGWLRLALTPGIGPVTGRRLVEGLGGAEAVAGAPPARLRALLGDRRASNLLRTRADPLLTRLEGLGQRVLTPADPEWPAARFESVAGAPLALFARGRLPPAGSPAVAVVGTRAPGPYGLRLARGMAGGLAERGIWVVSGLALGIDGAAHAAALGGGRAGTLAVLGCGLDVPYPVEHLDLRERIVAQGALLSEYPPGTEPRRGHFPQRNRIVAALVDAVVVVEAPRRSGALLTAGRAVEIGREVLVVPGPVGAAYRGSHDLLRRGQAALCEGVIDVLHALGLERATDPVPGVAPRAPPAAGAPLAIWGVLEEDRIASLDEVGRRTGLAPEVVAAAATQLEIEGYVARVPGAGVRRL